MTLPAIDHLFTPTNGQQRRLQKRVTVHFVLRSLCAQVARAIGATGPREPANLMRNLVALCWSLAAIALKGPFAPNQKVKRLVFDTDHSSLCDEVISRGAKVAEKSAVVWVGPEFQLPALPRTCKFKSSAYRRIF